MAHRSALVLLAPAVHGALWDLRSRHLRHLGRKMPSHVTVLFPFHNPLEAGDLHRLDDVASRLTPFDATFADVGRFGSSVVWLRPEPADAFEKVIDTVRAEFTDCLPYGGKHRTQTPHLSVGSRLRQDVADALAREVRPLLPLRDRIDTLSLMFETGDGWRHDRSFAFGGP